MANPKTTIAGYLVLVGSVLTLLGHIFVTGGAINGVDVSAVFSAATGIGLIAAKDGGH